MHNPKIKIDTIIVSDLHLGSRLARTNKLLETLRQYDFKRLILNGDVLDGFNLKRFDSDHWSVLSYLRKLSKTKEVVWVEGNHDSEAKNVSALIGAKVYSYYSWSVNKKKLIAIHGHQFDRVGHKNFILGGLGLFLYFVIHKLLGNHRFFSFLAEKVDGKWLRMSEQVSRGALYFARLKNADYIFCGHTHITMESSMDKIKYYNSGSWDEIPSGFITLEGENISVKKVD